jgi:hypothetical protein
MTGKQFKKIRLGLGLDQLSWGRALGYTGEIATVGRMMRFFESGSRTIPVRTARLAEMFQLYGVPNKWQPPIYCPPELRAKPAGKKRR